MSSLNNFLGDSPVRVIVKLVLVSLVVGYVMSVFGWTPYEMLYWLRDTVLDIWHAGFAAFGRAFGYILIGAGVVIPVYIVIRLINYRRN